MRPSFSQIPNLISLCRIALVVPIAISLVEGRPGATLWLLAAAAVSDGADGFLAKRFGWQTEVGAVLDPAADKLLLATVFITLAVLGGVPIWLMAAAVGRDVVIVGGALAYRAWIGPLHIRPSAVSKMNTLCQIGFVACLVANRRFGEPPTWVVTLLGALVLMTVAISGIDYVLRFSGRAVALTRSRRVGFGAGGESP